MAVHEGQHRLIPSPVAPVSPTREMRLYCLSAGTHHRGKVNYTVRVLPRALRRQLDLTQILLLFECHDVRELS